MTKKEAQLRQLLSQGLNKAKALGRLGKQKGSKYVEEYSDHLSGKKWRQAREKLRKDRQMLGSDKAVSNQGGIAKSRQKLKDAVRQKRRKMLQSQGTLVGAPFAAGVGSGFALDGEEKTSFYKKGQAGTILKGFGKSIDELKGLAGTAKKNIPSLKDIKKGVGKAGDDLKSGYTGVGKPGRPRESLLARVGQKSKQGVNWAKENPWQATGVGAGSLGALSFMGKDAASNDEKRQAAKRMIEITLAYKNGKLNENQIPKKALKRIKKFDNKYSKDQLQRVLEKNAKAESKSQQRLMGMAYAYKKGELDTEDISKEMLGKIKDIADSMTMKELKEYAETDRKGLPEEKNASKFYEII